MDGRTPGAKIFDSPSNCVGDSTDTTILLSSGEGVCIVRAHEWVSLDLVLGGEVVHHSSDQLVRSHRNVYPVTRKESHCSWDKAVRNVSGCGVRQHNLLQRVARELRGKGTPVEEKKEFARYRTYDTFYNRRQLETPNAARGCEAHPINRRQSPQSSQDRQQKGGVFGV